MPIPIAVVREALAQGNGWAIRLEDLNRIAQKHKVDPKELLRAMQTTLHGDAEGE